jgi:glycosyltransferase involved in cell wall biosynthesis
METTLKKKKVMVALLCHNESESIPNVLDNISSTFPWENYDADVYIFDNGSSDNLPAVLERYKSTNSIFSPIYENSDLNVGYSGNGFRAIEKFRTSKVNYLLIIDGDGEFPPSYAIDYLTQLEIGNDLILAKRINSSGNISRIVGSTIFLNMCKLFLNFRGPDLNGGFRGLSSEFANQLIGIHRGKTLNPLLYSEARKFGCKISWVELKTIPRQHGNSFLDWTNPTKMLFEAILELFRISHRQYEFYFSNVKK